MRAEPRLLQRVLLPVPGQEQGRALAYEQVFRSYANSAAAQLLHLLQETLAVQRHAGTQDVQHPGPEHARGQQVQRKFAQLIFHRVARVPAALVADDGVAVLGEQVHHPALALVAPVEAYHCAQPHSFASPLPARAPLAP